MFPTLLNLLSLKFINIKLANVGERAVLRFPPVLAHATFIIIFYMFLHLKTRLLHNPLNPSLCYTKTYTPRTTTIPPPHPPPPPPPPPPPETRLPRNSWHVNSLEWFTLVSLLVSRRHKPECTGSLLLSETRRRAEW